MYFYFRVRLEDLVMVSKFHTRAAQALICILLSMTWWYLHKRLRFLMFFDSHYLRNPSSISLTKINYIWISPSFESRKGTSLAPSSFPTRPRSQPLMFSWFHLRSLLLRTLYACFHYGRGILYRSF